MGFERNYLVKLLSNQLKIFNLSGSSSSSTSSSFSSTSSFRKTMLNPYFFSGFADAESCFSTTIDTNDKLKTGYRVKSSFVIKLNHRDISLISQLKEFFSGVGTISIDNKANAVKYSVDSLKDLTTIVIPHFKKYPLITQKLADFILFYLNK